MTERLQVYKCGICGNLVIVLHTGVGKLVCCGQPMVLMAEKTDGPGAEKHVPVIEATGERIRVRVGEVEHPMDEGHYIEWIELVVGDEVYRCFLRPGGKPEAEFPFSAGEVVARAYCNKHGLWKATTLIGP